MMENQNMHFNELVDKLKYGESTVPEAVWGKIEATLNQGRRKSAIYFWSIGLAITFVIAGSTSLLWLNDSSKTTKLTQKVFNDKKVGIDNQKLSTNARTMSLSDGSTTNGIQEEFNTFKENQDLVETKSSKHSFSLTDQKSKARSKVALADYTPTPEEIANQEKFSHNKVQPIATLLPINQSDLQIIEDKIAPLSGEFTPEQLNKEYRLFSVYAGYGIFDQNLIMANPHADTVSFRAEKGHQFNVGVQYNLTKNWAVDLNFGRSSNNWSSAARLIVEEEAVAGGIDPHVYLSTNFQFNEVTNQNDVQEILNEKPEKDDIRLVHQMKYTHYRLGFTYSINDFKHWDFRALLQAEYMQLRDVSTFFQAGDHSISYPVSGFRKGIWALRPGINIAYKLNDSFSIYTEGSTSVRGTYLMKHPNWKIYENQFGLFCGLRYSW